MANQLWGVVGAIVGGVIGFYSGNVWMGAQYGYAIGSGIGAVADPEQIEGPRLQDRAVQVSSYGKSIPIIYGGDAVAGNVIWATDLQETATESSGKGGPEVTTYSYSVSCAILIAEGELPGLRRIWADAKLVYDVSEGADEQTEMASLIFAEYLTFYSGAEDQLPDPTMEAALGAGNVSAYRGYCYVVFTDLPLGDYGNRIPNFRFEIGGVAEQGSSDEDPLYEALKIYPWTDDVRPVHSRGGTNFYYADGSGGYSGTSYATALSRVASFPAYDASGAFSQTAFSYRTSLINRQSVFGVGMGGATLAGDPQYVHYLLGIAVPDVIAPLPNRGDFANWNFGQWGDSMKRAGASIGDGLLYYSIDNEPAIHAFVTKAVPRGELPSPGFIGVNVYVLGSDPLLWGGVHGNPTQEIRALRMPALPPDSPGCPEGDPCALGIATRMPGNPNYCMSCDGTISKRRAITWSLATGVFRQLAPVLYQDGALYQNALGPVRPQGHPEYDDAAFWAAARAEALADGTLHADVSTPVDASEVAIADITDDDEPITSAELNADLGEIVADLCDRAGMPAGTYNVDALYGIEVQGYTVTRQMPVRAAILPLQQCFWWDFVESGAQIKAVRRGGASVASIGLDELGATEGGDAPIRVVPNRAQESELPATVTVSYPVRLASYEAGTQRARRVTTRSQQEVANEFAVVMPDEHAADVADVLMYLAWTNRTTRQFSTTRKYARLEPTDVVTVNDGEFDTMLRIVDRSEDGQVIKWTAVDERPGAYAPNTTPGTVVGGNPGIRFDGPMKLLLLDTPLLRDADDGPGHYAAAGGYLPSWTAGTAFRSYDDGASYSAVRDMDRRATFGYATTVLGSFDGGNMVDEANSVTVRMHHGTLSTITQAQLLNDGNPALLGAELIQFKRAELVSTGVYKLTGLLRGRRGTEQHMGTHAVDDLFVLLSTTNTYRIADALADINRPAVWKGVTHGTSLADAFEVDFTNTGISSKPLAPTHLHAVDIGGGQYRVSWVRRTRIGGKWRDGVDVPLGEASELYRVETLDEFGTVTSTRDTTASSIVVGGADGDAFDGTLGYTSAVVELEDWGPEIVGIRYGAIPLKDNGLVKFQPDGTYVGVIAIGGVMGKIQQIEVASSDDLYACALRALDPSQVYRVDRTTFAIAATYTGDAAGDNQGVAFDGTYVWTAETYSGRIRKLHGTTLALEDTFALNVGVGVMHYDAGTDCLFIADRTNDRIIRFSCATETVVSYYTGCEFPMRVLVTNGVLFVVGRNFYVYDVASGTLLSTDPALEGFLIDTGTSVVTSWSDNVPLANEVVYFSRATGAELRRRTFDGLRFLCGYAGGGLWVRVLVGGSPQVRKLVPLTIPASGAVRVTQVSATAGPGFPSTVIL